MPLNKLLSRFLFPLLLIVAVTVFKFRFNEMLGARTPFLLYTAVVIATTWYSGWAIGMVTNFICLAVIDYFFLEPTYSFLFPARITIQMAIFTGQNMLLAAMGYSMKSALKRSEAAENKFRLLVEQACDVLVLRDESGQATYVSPRVTEIFGFTPEEYKAQVPERLYPPESLAHYQNSVKQIMETPGASKLVRLQFIRQDGRRGWLEGELYNYLNEPGIYALVNNFRDVTERVDIERQKDGFIGITSHELKTPLTSIKAYLQVLELKAKRLDDPFFAEALFKANQQVKKMTVMINGFLNLSRFESGKLHIDKQTFDLNELVNEIIAENRPIMSGHDITFAPAPSAFIAADRDKIGSVISNLISNAAKYSVNGKNIQIATTVTAHEVQLSVLDQGIGIRPEDKKRLFERYYRVETDQNKHVSGFGIGLYLSAEIVKLHQGRIWVESEIGQGSTFYFSLPVA
jgi:two-component system sensor histidine kinase VicK